MASDLIIAGITFSTAPTGAAARPVSIEVEVKKVGVLLESMNGSRTWVHFGIKRTWTVKWKAAGTATRAQLRTIHEITATQGFTDELGVAYTIVTTETDYKEATAYSDRANVYFYDLEIVLRQV